MILYVLFIYVYIYIYMRVYQDFLTTSKSKYMIYSSCSSGIFFLDTYVLNRINVILY